MSQTVIGIFENFSQAQDAKSHLVANGFTEAEVDITRKKSGDSDEDHDEGLGERISNFFKNLFSNEDEAASHIAAAKKGNVVTVHAASLEQAEQAQDILNRYGALDVDDYNKRYKDGLTGDRADSYRYSETANDTTNRYTETSIHDDDDVRSGLRTPSIPGAGYAGSMTPTESLDSNDDRARYEGKGDFRDTDATGKIKVIKEDLQVGKREVETGGVRLRSKIVERPVEESIRLREEHVNIERNTVDRPATEADFADFKEGTVEVTEYAEKPVVAKTARVVEEVSLDKEVTEREETISDTVRHTEVETEKIPSSDSRFIDDEEIIESQETNRGRGKRKYDDKL